MSVEDFLERKLAACSRAWSAGNFPALIDAVALCVKHSRPLPAWAAAATLQALAERFDGLTENKRGRLANPKALYRQNSIHYSRWDAVNELHERRAELEEKYGYELSWDLEKEENIYTVASKYLAEVRSPAFGGPDAIRKSYQRVERAFKEGRGAEYYITEFTPKPPK